MKADLSALYDFVLKETAKWEALNKVRTINIDENENLEKVTDPRANVNVQLDDISAEVYMHRAQIRDACLTIRGWDAKITQCLDSLDSIDKKFRSTESIVARLDNTRIEMQELIAG